MKLMTYIYITIIVLITSPTVNATATEEYVPLPVDKQVGYIIDVEDDIALVLLYSPKREFVKMNIEDSYIKTMFEDGMNRIEFYELDYFPKFMETLTIELERNHVKEYDYREVGTLYGFDESTSHMRYLTDEGFISSDRVDLTVPYHVVDIRDFVVYSPSMVAKQDINIAGKPFQYDYHLNYVTFKNIYSVITNNWYIESNDVKYNFLGFTENWVPMYADETYTIFKLVYEGAIMDYDEFLVAYGVEWEGDFLRASFDQKLNQ